MLYHVVKFCQTNELAVVPVGWVNDGVCTWPPYQNQGRIDRAVKKSEAPGDDWTKHDVTVMYQSATLDKARRKVKLAEICSDLQTGEEDNTGRSHRKHVVRRFSSSAEEEEENAPKSKQPKSNKKKKNSHKLPSPPLAPKFPDSMTLAVASSNRPLISPNSSPLSSDDEHEMNDLLMSPVTSQVTPVAGSNSSSMQADKTLETATKGNHQTSSARKELPASQDGLVEVTTPRSALGGNELRASMSAGCSSIRRLLAKADEGSITCSSIDREILLSLENISQQQERNYKTLLAMFAFIKGEADTRQSTTSPTLNIDLPLTNREQFFDLANRIEADKATKDALVAQLALRGGATVRDAVWRILGTLVNHELGKNVSWSGTYKTKIEFGVSALKDVVVAAVRKNPPTAKESDELVEQWVKRYFQLSGDRNGGRKAREEKKRANESVARTDNDLPGFNL